MSVSLSRKHQQMQELIKLSESVKKLEENSAGGESTSEQSSFGVNLRNNSNFFSENHAVGESKDELLGQSMRQALPRSPLSQNVFRQAERFPEQFHTLPSNALKERVVRQTKDLSFTKGDKNNV